MKEILRSTAAPPPGAAYSQAVRAGDLIFLAGQTPRDPATARVIDGGVAAQTERVLLNFQGILESAGCGLTDIVRATVYLTSWDDFDEMNGAYARIFGDVLPARTTLVVASIRFGAKVAMDAVAYAPR